MKVETDQNVSPSQNTAMIQNAWTFEVLFILRFLHSQQSNTENKYIQILAVIGLLLLNKVCIKLERMIIRINKSENEHLIEWSWNV